MIGCHVPVDGPIPIHTLTTLHGLNECRKESTKLRAKSGWVSIGVGEEEEGDGFDENTLFSCMQISISFLKCKNYLVIE